jgi:predicted metalloprotease with PDZ domain
MYLADRLDAPATVRFSSKPKEWNIATQLIRTGDHQVYTAPSFHYLIDSPTLMSPTLRTFKFEALGKPIYAHFQGRWGVPDGEEKPWLDGVRRMIEQQAAVFGEFPCPEYHLIYLLLPSNYRSATEHDNSAMFAVPEATTESARTLNGLNGITSHELWHLWNVKRLRPAALWPYRYDREVPTSLHWLTEGITSYYDDLILKRTGLLDQAQSLFVIGCSKDASCFFKAFDILPVECAEGVDMAVVGEFGGGVGACKHHWEALWT